MKINLFFKRISIFLIFGILVVLSFVLGCDIKVECASDLNNFEQVIDSYNKSTNILGRTDEEQAEYDEFVRLMKLKEDTSKIENMFKEKKTGLTKDEAKEICQALGVAKDVIKRKADIVKDIIDGGDFDTATYLDSVISTVSSVLAMCGPYGMVASAIVDIGNTIFKLLMGGEPGTSEIAQMEDRINQKLDDMSNQLSGIEEQITELSKQVSSSANYIVNSITTAIDNADSKNQIREFMLSSGSTDFSYNQYKAYISKDIINASEGYFSYYYLLNNALVNNDKDNIKYYSDQLYSAIMSNRESFKGYVLGDSYGKSIIQCFYDVVSANPKLIEDKGTSPEYEALMFANDIYQTELTSNIIILMLNNLQYEYMCDNNTDVYVYDSVSGKRVTKAEIDGDDNIISIANQIEARNQEIFDSIAKDIGYILNLDKSYILEDFNGNLYDLIDNGENFGNVLPGHKIYLNNIPSIVCDIFGFDKDDFKCEVSVPTNIDGIIVVDEYTKSIEVNYFYKNSLIDTMIFTVSEGAKFNGGTGSANDPYLICNAYQFMNIRDNLTKYYKLINDIDFECLTTSPIGLRVNSNNSYVYDEFTGCLDGNGYTISNLNIKSSTASYSGLFCIIGDNGIVKNLNLKNINVMSDINNAEDTISHFYGGILAGANNGYIKYCNIINDDKTKTVKTVQYIKDIYTMDEIYEYLNRLYGYSYGSIEASIAYSSIIATLTETIDSCIPYYGLSIQSSNKTRNRNITVYAGGLVGVNNNDILGCIVDNIDIYAASSHDFGGDSTKQNKNYTYVGGICGFNNGTLGYSLVKENTILRSRTRSSLNPQTTVNPYIGTNVGGITGGVSSGFKSSDINSVKSEAIIGEYSTIINGKSGWIPGYKNCDINTAAYIPNIAVNQLEEIKTTEDIEDLLEDVNEKYTVDLRFGSDNSNDSTKICIYEPTEDQFNTSDMKVLVDDIERNYQILGIYGFNTDNEKFELLQKEITLLLLVDVDGEMVFISKDLSIIVKENYIEQYIVTNINDYYEVDTFNPYGLVIEYDYKVGESKYVTINDSIINDIEVYGDFNNPGLQKVCLVYDGEEIEFEINIKCTHSNNFLDENSGYVNIETIAPTCTKNGYAKYRCSCCGDVQYYYYRSHGHTSAEELVGARSATCVTEGYTGDVHCVDCDVILEEGESQPKIKHVYRRLNDDMHQCMICKKEEYHHYSIKEGTQAIINDNGETEWALVYTYTCESCHYLKEYVDDNQIIDETTVLPTVVVSSGYVLNGGDAVSVYIQLLNNPGINAANFGIRYSSGLELLSKTDGNVLKGSLISEGTEVNYGYNFVWANDNYFTNDGNLVKLTFKVAEYAKVGDAFDISVVYAVGNGAKGGFATKAGKECFVTRDGLIQVVEHLPGDVNNDKVVDLMDAIEIGNFVIGKTDSINEEYANVNLSFEYDKVTNVDIMDMVAILQSITGGYGVNLENQDFKIVLNTNGYNYNIKDLDVSIYGDNNTYDVAGLEELVRDGYRFVGWFDKPVGGTKINISDHVTYNVNQKKQTLYAQWELNELIIDTNGATSGEIENIYYSEEEFVNTNINVEKEYKVAFISKKFNTTDNTKLLSYEFLEWKGSNGKSYKNLDEACDDLLNEHYGCVTIKAMWSEKPKLAYPEWNKQGYEAVEWYCDANFITDQIEKDINEANILKYTPIDGYYRVYAKYNPIVYNIVFDFNGGTSKMNTVSYSHSIDTPYIFDKSMPVVKSGYNFKNWVDNYGNVYFENQIDSIIGAKQNDIITLEAVWSDEIPYSITLYYNYNNDIDTLDKNVKTSIAYTVSEIDSINLPNISHGSKYGEYHKFLGWYDENGVEFDIATVNSSNVRNIELYGKWDLCPIYNSIKTIPSLIESERVIIDWSDVSNNVVIGKTISFENLKEIYIIGNPSVTYKNLTLNLYGNSSNKNVKLRINNFNFTGALHQDNNSSNLSVKIDYLGNNSILALDRNTAIDGFNSLELYSSYIDAKLCITGGNGSNGSNGNNVTIESNNYNKTPGNGQAGEAGFMAIDCTKTTINTIGKLYITGGNGGAGGNGGNVDGTSNSNGGPKLPTGGTGGAGGDGGKPLDISKLIIKNTGYIQLNYGNGGTGGNGGKGGDAFEVTNVTPDNGGNGGVGGAGGAGFISGAGGTGGTGGHSFGASNGWGVSSKGTSGDGGKGGDSGRVICGIIIENGKKSLCTGTSGNVGVGGSRGSIDDGGGVMGHYGVAGKSGSYLPTDYSFYNSLSI